MRSTIEYAGGDGQFEVSNRGAYESLADQRGVTLEEVERAAAAGTLVDIIALPTVPPQYRASKQAGDHRDAAIKAGVAAIVASGGGASSEPAEQLYRDHPVERAASPTELRARPYTPSPAEDDLLAEPANPHWLPESAAEYLRRHPGATLAAALRGEQFEPYPPLPRKHETPAEGLARLLDDPSKTGRLWGHEALRRLPPNLEASSAL